MEGQCVDQQTCVLSITEQSIHLLNHLSASEEDDNGWNLNQSESYSDDDSQSNYFFQ
jgi:flagellar biogenesis protein FliO